MVQKTVFQKSFKKLSKEDKKILELQLSNALKGDYPREKIKPLIKKCIDTGILFILDYENNDVSVGKLTTDALKKLLSPCLEHVKSGGSFTVLVKKPKEVEEDLREKTRRACQVAYADRDN